MNEPAIELDWELDKELKKASQGRAKTIRKRLVMGAGNSRPRALVNGMSRLFGDGHLPSQSESNGEQDEKQNERAQALLEKFFWGFSWAAWILVVLATVVSERFPGARSYLFENWAAGVGLGIIGLVLLLVIMLDVATYEPRLFAMCSGSPTRFFKGLSKLSTTLKKQLEQIEKECPETWRRAKELEQGLLAESSDFLVLGGVRTRIIVRVMHRLAGIVASLALLGYGLSALSGGGLLATCNGVGKPGKEACINAAKSLPEHVYFALDSFFTGFSDVTLVHDALGYGYLTVIVISFTAVVYFFLTEVVASQSEFRANMRSAAESYVLQQSRL